MTARLDYTPCADLETEVARLRLALRVERERRVMSVLWGARDEDCPRAFSLYCHEDPDPAHADDPDVGVIAYGIVWPDGYTVLRSCIHNDLRVWRSHDDMMSACVHGTEGRMSLVWLSEDVNELTDSIYDHVGAQYRNRFTSDAARVRVAQVLSDADPVDSTWQDCVTLADAAIAALFVVDEP